MKQELKSGKIYLDANIFIYLLENHSEFSSVLIQLFDLIDIGKLQAFTSELSLAETLVKPILDKNFPLQNLYESTIQTSTNLNVCSIDRHILIFAAKLRAALRPVHTSIRLPDAIHIATAQTYQCNYFITNDKALCNLPGIQVLILSDMKTAEIILV